MSSFKIGTLVLIIISLSVSFIVFLISGYRESTLNIDAISMEKGIGTVLFEGVGFYGSSSRKFEINEYQGDQGLKKLYVIELPATKLKTITIDPQIRNGLFGIDRIILANDAISYTWDEQGVCSQQKQVHGFQKKEPCKDGTPSILAAADSSVVISAIPETGFTNTFDVRVAKALVIGCGTFLGGIWLLWPCAKQARSTRLHRLAFKLAWLAIAVGFLYQLYLVIKYSVDVPRQDEVAPIIGTGV